MWFHENKTQVVQLVTVTRSCPLWDSPYRTSKLAFWNSEIYTLTSYSYLPNTTPWVIIRTGVGIPSLGFYYCTWFSLFPTLGYYPALCFLFFPPLATIQPLVFSFSLPGLLSNPWFSTFTHPWLRFSFFSSLVYNISHPWFSLFSTLGYYSALGFLIFPPWAIIQPLVFSFSNPWLLFSPWFSLLASLGHYSALGFPLFPTLGCYPALGLYSAGKSTP